MLSDGLSAVSLQGRYGNGSHGRPSDACHPGEGRKTPERVSAVYIQPPEGRRGRNHSLDGQGDIRHELPGMLHVAGNRRTEHRHRRLRLLRCGRLPRPRQGRHASIKPDRRGAGCSDRCAPNHLHHLLLGRWPRGREGRDAHRGGPEGWRRQGRGDGFRHRSDRSITAFTLEPPLPAWSRLPRSPTRRRHRPVVRCVPWPADTTEVPEPEPSRFISTGDIWPSTSSFSLIPATHGSG